MTPPDARPNSLMANSVDQAIRGRNEDLLGAAAHARVLADTIRPITSRFTLGIYGKWGAGKTSFVKLLEGELGSSVRFIDFTAWPYKTSDELWRALMIKIASDLYAPLSPPEVTPFVTRVGKFLSQPAFGSELVARQEPDISTFEKFIEQLNATLLASIQKSNSQAAEDDRTLATIASVV